MPVNGRSGGAHEGFRGHFRGPVLVVMLLLGMQVSQKAIDD
jgi:hypothetical protein